MVEPITTLPAPPDWFFASLAIAPARVLMLDYDGTLAPFRTDPARARPYAGVEPALARIIASGHTRLVIVSGRTIEELGRLILLRPLPELWGSHGWERMSAEGRYEVSPVPSLAREGIEAAAGRARAAGLADRLEPKLTSVALHWRGQPAAEAKRIQAWGREDWGQAASAAGLALHAFDGGLELRVPGHDKGSAVRSIAEESLSGAAAAFLGDDLTDEDAFRALPSGGLGVLVRREPRATAAMAWLRPPRELLGFFDRWNVAAG